MYTVGEKKSRVEKHTTAVQEFVVSNIYYHYLH